MSLTHAPRRQQTALWGGSAWHIGPSIPLRKELPTTKICGDSCDTKLGLSDLGDTSGVDGQSSTPSTDWLSTSKPSSRAPEAPGRARWAKREFDCHPERVLVSIHLFHLDCCLQPNGGRIQGPLEIGCFLVGAPISVSEMAESGSTSLSLAISASLILNNFLQPVAALPPGWAHCLPGHTAHSCAHYCRPLPAKGFVTPWGHAAWDQDSCMLLWEFHLGCHMSSGENMAFCQVETTAELPLRGWWPPTELAELQHSSCSPFCTNCCTNCLSTLYINTMFLSVFGRKT